MTPLISCTNDQCVKSSNIPIDHRHVDAQYIHLLKVALQNPFNHCLIDASHLAVWPYLKA